MTWWREVSKNMANYQLERMLALGKNRSQIHKQNNTTFGQVLHHNLISTRLMSMYSRESKYLKKDENKAEKMKVYSTALPAGQKQAPPVPISGLWLLHAENSSCVHLLQWYWSQAVLGSNPRFPTQTPSMEYIWIISNMRNPTWKKKKK